MEIIEQIKYAERHKNFNPAILTRLIDQETTNPAIVLSLSSKESKLLWNCCNEVMNEIVNCVAFSNPIVEKKSLVFYISPIHDVEDLILNKLKQFFPEQKLILFSLKGTFTY